MFPEIDHHKKSLAKSKDQNPINNSHLLTTSKRMHRRTWKIIIGIFIIWPPTSGRPHILISCDWSSSDETTRPLFLSRYLIVEEDEAGILVWALQWITGLDHFVQTRKAKHSATLRCIKKHYLLSLKKFSYACSIFVKASAPNTVICKVHGHLLGMGILP